MNRFLSTLMIVVLITFIVACSSQTGSSEQSSSTNDLSDLSIGAGTVGGGFHSGATAISNVINENLEGIQANVEVTGSSVNNVELLQAGEVQIGLSATEVAWEAYHGEFTFEGNSHDKLRTLLPGWPGVYMFITLEESGINSIQDLNGIKYSSGPKGSSNEVFADRVFKTFGIEPDILNLPTSDAANALKDGTIDGFSIAWPTEAVTELETSHNVKIITLTEEEKEKFLEENPPYPWLSIPPDTYKAVPDGKENFGLYNLFLVRDDIPNEVVYNIVKTVYENKDTIEQIWPQMASGMGFENINQTTIPYHPGAVEYFEEQGVDIPEDLLPPTN